ncbi:hypothetical protein ACFO3D_08490 [Virgibacillus kekensis]|uniref:DUF4064 domain-containing protein n=1 Tax=Virgibacillus kekensis TaxID=202261 RepID=A0ABV9DHD6_9BACI
MNDKYIHQMALAGSALGIVGSVLWVYYGTLFIGGWIEGDMKNSLTLTDSALRTGLIIAFIQSVVSIAFFIVTLVKTTRWHIEVNSIHTGKWFLYSGIGIAVINLFQLVPCALLITAGVFCLKRQNKPTESSRGSQKPDENTAGVIQP